MLSAAKARRTQSMKALSHNSEINPNVRTRSTSTSSASSVTSLKKVETESIASSSSSTSSSTGFKEIDLKPVVEKSKRVTFTSGVDLRETVSSMHDAAQTQTGVYTRMRNTLRRHGLRVVASSAIATGGFAVGMNFNYIKQTFTSSTITSNVSNNTINVVNSTQTIDYDDDIINKL